MSSIRGYHRLGELRILYGASVARAVISAVRAHAEIVRVDPTTGEELGGYARADDSAYVAPEVWGMLMHVAAEYAEHLELVERLQATRARLARMAQQDRKYIKEGKSVVEQQQRELLQAQREHNAAAEGQIGYFIKKNLQEVAEYEDALAQHAGRLRTCDDLLQRLM